VWFAFALVLTRTHVFFHCNIVVYTLLWASYPYVAHSLSLSLTPHILSLTTHITVPRTPSTLRSHSNVSPLWWSPTSSRKSLRCVSFFLSSPLHLFDTHLLTHSLTHSLTHLFDTHSLTHLFDTHSLTHSPFLLGVLVRLLLCLWLSSSTGRWTWTRTTTRRATAAAHKCLCGHSYFHQRCCTRVFLHAVAPTLFAQYSPLFVFLRSINTTNQPTNQTIVSHCSFNPQYNTNHTHTHTHTNHPPSTT
jgi:hypothetical protein